MRWQRKIFRRISARMKLDDGLYVRMINNEIHELYDEAQINDVIKLKWQWLRYIEGTMEDRTVKIIRWREPDYSPINLRDMGPKQKTK